MQTSFQNLKQKFFCIVSFSATCPGPGCRGNSLSREIQTFLSLATSPNSSRRGHTKTLIILPMCPWSAHRSPPGRECLKHLPRETSRKHLNQMPKPPQLAPLNTQEQQLYSELLPDVPAPHPISNAESSHPPKKTLSGCLQSGSLPRAHDHR